MKIPYWILCGPILFMAAICGVIAAAVGLLLSLPFLIG
jgi:hypothetical protein